jgi:hypothetical protein
MSHCLFKDRFPKMKSRVCVRYLCAFLGLLAWACLNLGLSSGQAAPQASPSISEARVSPGDDNDPRDETSIAVNPRNEQNLVGASKVIVDGASGSGVSRVAYYFSLDGGQTWGNGILDLVTPQKLWNRASDPSVVVDSEGNFYICLLMLDETSGSFDTGIYTYKSVDGGRTFGVAEPVVFDIGQTIESKRADKCYATVDLNDSSPFKNTIYVVWISSEPTRTVILMSHRRPGESVFSQPKTLSHSGTMLGPALAIGPDGEFYAVWQGLGNPRVMLFNASTDGGETFFPPVVAHPDFNVYRYVGSLTQPFDPPLVIGVRRMNSFPSIDVDRSQGPNRGMIYLAWAETLNGVDADVFIQKVTPPGGGAPGLSNRIKVNTDQGLADQFFPWISVDPSNGAVEVAFYDRRDDPGNLLMNAYLARSTDGGATFSDNVRVSGESSNPLVQSTVEASFGNQIGIGDYLGLTALNGKAHLLWTDTRHGKQEIFYGKVQFEPSGGGGGGGGGPSNDGCQTPKVITVLPFTEVLDTAAATSEQQDPQSCSGSAGTNSVWYSFASVVDTVYGLDSIDSDYDTVLSVYTGICGALTRISCNDNSQGSGSLLTFNASAGTNYLIEAVGKGNGGALHLRLGFPTISEVSFTRGPDGSKSLRITGAGFTNGSASVVVRKDGEDNILPTTFFSSTVEGDGTVTQLFATKKKLKKLVKKGQPVVVTVESPAGSGRTSRPFTFTR